MYRELQHRLQKRIAEVLKEKYGLDTTVAIDAPPSVALGEFAVPVFPLAQSLRKAPKAIAEEVVAALGTVEGFAQFEAAGGGYVNARLDRTSFVEGLSSPRRHGDTERKADETVLVEHTSINPN